MVKGSSRLVSRQVAGQAAATGQLVRYREGPRDAADSGGWRGVGQHLLEHLTLGYLQNLVAKLDRHFELEQMAITNTTY